MIVSRKGFSDAPIQVVIPNPYLWTPQSPFLYDMVVTLENGADMVKSYTGLRKVSLGKDKSGTTRPLINGNFTFLAGWLDQSYWVFLYLAN